MFKSNGVQLESSLACNFIKFLAARVSCPAASHEPTTRLLLVGRLLLRRSEFQ